MQRWNIGFILCDRSLTIKAQKRFRESDDVIFRASVQIPLSTLPTPKMIIQNLLTNEYFIRII